MKAIEILPTPENIKKMFLEDAIDRNRDVVRLCTILNNIEGSCSIALDGKWGSGKTFFVKQAKLLLDTYNDHICIPIEDAAKEQIKQAVSRAVKAFEVQPQVAVYYDAQ